MTKAINWLTRKAAPQPGVLDPALALEVYQYLLQQLPTSADRIFTRIQPALKPVWLKKGDYLLTSPEVAGDISRDSNRFIYFVARGLLRSYRADADGREFNTRFFDEASVCADLNQLATNGDSAVGPDMPGDQRAAFIQAMEPTLVIRTLSVSEYHQHSRDDLDFARFSIHCLHQQLLRRQQREFLLQLNSARERVGQLQRLYAPELLARIPQYHLASYLGLNEITFSRAKKACRQAH